MKRAILILAAIVCAILAGTLIAQAQPCFWNLSFGDANCDGMVDIFDFSGCANSYSSKPECFIMCDHNQDGVCDIFDFSILATNYNTTVPTPPVPTPTPEPTLEPGPLGLKGVAWTGCIGGDGCAHELSRVEHIDRLGIDTWFNWGFSGVSNWRVAKDTGTRYVPMYRPDGLTTSEKIQAFAEFMGPGNYYLIFNEPNVWGQDEITPEEAVPIYMYASELITEADPDAKLIVGGVLHSRGNDWKNWLNEFWNLLPPEGRDRIYGWHAHFYIFRCSVSGPDPKDCWVSNINWFVDWCHAHSGQECWDTEGPELPSDTPDEFFRLFIQGRDDHPFGDCQGMTCMDWWRRRFDAVFWWSMYEYYGAAGALVNDDDTLTPVGEWFKEE